MVLWNSNLACDISATESAAMVRSCEALLVEELGPIVVGVLEWSKHTEDGGRSVL